MSALDVIAIPGYPGWYARRRAVEAWQRAGSPHLTSAGRLYDSQKYLYDGWRAGRPGFNPADNPDDESQRLAHVRFVAFDIANPNRDRAAMIREGFIFPYSYEPWHAELPNVRSYPIVRTIPATSGGSSKPFPETATIQEDDMATLITGGGQSLVVGDELFGFRSAQEVQAVKGAQVLEVSPATHYDIIQRFQRRGGTGLPLRVFVKDGNGTVYLLQNGDLTPLVDPATLAELDTKGGPAITLSQAEIDNLLEDR